MHTWDSVNCIPLEIFADGHATKYYIGIYIVISQLLVTTNQTNLYQVEY